MVKVPAKIMSICPRISRERKSQRALLKVDVTVTRISGAGGVTKNITKATIKPAAAIIPKIFLVSIVSSFTYVLLVRLIADTNNAVIKPAQTLSSNIAA